MIFETINDHLARQGHFGMKAHIGVDADPGLVHTLVTTPANVHDVTLAHALLHGRERYAAGDAGYQGVAQRKENRNTQIQWDVAMHPGRRRQLDRCTAVGRLPDAFERIKTRLRAQIEHLFHVIKNLFRHRKTRHRGLARNTAQLQTLLGLANLVMAGWRLRRRDTAA